MMLGPMLCTRVTSIEYQRYHYGSCEGLMEACRRYSVGSKLRCAAGSLPATRKADSSHPMYFSHCSTVTRSSGGPSHWTSFCVIVQ